MGKIKLVALDMDGTLLDSRKNPPADFEDWVCAHEEIAVVLASGRQYETLRRQFPGIRDRLSYIADNGAFVFHKGRMIYAREMNHEGVLQCLLAFEAIPGCCVGKKVLSCARTDRMQVPILRSIIRA